jgi:hypothetical protein
MDKFTEFDLFYDAVLVGHIGNAFISDATRYGVFDPRSKLIDETLGERLQKNGMNGFETGELRPLRIGPYDLQHNRAVLGCHVFTGSWHLVHRHSG